MEPCRPKLKCTTQERALQLGPPGMEIEDCNWGVTPTNIRSLKNTRMEIFEGMGIDRAYTNRMFLFFGSRIAIIHFAGWDMRGTHAIELYINV